jgi:signal peptide peptidase SppA
MRYLHIISAFAAEAWAMQPEKLQAIADFLAFKAHGGHLSEEEIQARVDGRSAAAVARREGDVAVMPLVGMISHRASMVDNASTSGGVAADQFGRRFDAFVQDDTVKTIIFDIDSAGGTVHGIEPLADKIRGARGAKPIIAQVNTKAASAAYWLACQADEIVLTPGAEAGSIGVFTVHEDISEKLAKDGVKPTLIKAGANKAELNNLAPLAAEARQALQVRIDAAYRSFVRSVAAGRGITASQVEDRFGQGRMFGQADLLDRGMVDRVATLEETIARFGGAPAQRAQQRSRETFAAGENPSLSVVEEVLRDAGFPKTLAVDFVSRGKGAFRRGDPGAEANAAGLSSLKQALAGWSKPQI